MEPDPDPDRHLKRVGRIFNVSSRIQKLAVQRKASPSKVVKDKDDRETIVRLRLPLVLCNIFIRFPILDEST